MTAFPEGTATRRALAEAPGSAGAWNLIGCHHLGRSEAAAALAPLRRAEASSATDAPIRGNLAGAALARGLHAEAARAARRALALSPALADAQLHLGTALQRELALAEAERHFRRAVSIEPGYLVTRELLAESVLLAGRFREGAEMFFDYQAANHGWADSLGIARGPRTLPARGDVLLVSDARLGDAIQFVRYAAWLAERGLRVTVECAEPLLRLFAAARGVSAVIRHGAPRPQVPQIPMHMLMHLLGDKWPVIGSVVPYLSADADRVAHWQRRFADTKDLKVGLVWAGRADGRDDHLRSPGLATFAPVLDVPGVTFFGLQLGDGRADLARIANRVVDLGDHLADMAETAAAMSALDLVITSDSSPAHLAGALGLPVWVAMHRAASWRWLTEGETSPWYPTMRLFRQTATGDWSRPMRNIAATLGMMQART